MAGAGRHIFVGGGIASLAGAALLLRDHGVRGSDIVILEASPEVGGSLDAMPVYNDLYAMRGARMFEAHCVCMLDLLGAIPSSDGTGNSLRDDLIAFNEEHPVPYGFDQLVDGRILGRHSGGLGPGQLAGFLRMMLASEDRLEGLKISQCLPRSYFDSEHWLAASTVFAFQPWHSAAEFRRYMRRFLHFVMPPEMRAPVLSTRYNQRDSIIAPLHAWLLRSGVEIRTAVRATDARFEQEGSGQRIVEIMTEAGPFPLGEDDRAYLTIGSMIDGTAIGAPNEAPPAPSGPLPAWEFWEQLSRRAPGFGRPDAFRADPRLTEWQSFTITLHSGSLGAHLAGLRPAGTHPSALLALTGSSWRLSILPAEQPHFRDQAAGTEVIWGYGLRPDLPGRFCGVPMTEATGHQVLDEIAGFLRLDGGERNRVLGDATVIGCRMPMITSQFLPRRRGDRPAVHPDGALNYACIGQFVELPDDTVFTVEYSIRSAWHAVASLNKGGPEPPGVVRPDRDLALIARALRYALRRAPPGGAG